MTSPAYRLLAFFSPLFAVLSSCPWAEERLRPVLSKEENVRFRRGIFGSRRLATAPAHTLVSHIRPAVGG